MTEEETKKIEEAKVEEESNKVEEESNKVEEESNKVEEESNKVEETKPEVVAKEMIDKEIEKEKVVEEKITKEKIKVFEKEDRKTARERKIAREKKEELENWVPKTKLGKEVKTGKIKNIDDILNVDKKILEEQIVDILLNINSDLIGIGQSKGKFGGGKRRAWRQTQRKTKEGNVPTFSAMAVVGDENGRIGIGSGKAKETLPARDKAIRKAKLNIIKISRGCSSFDCDCSELHTIPFKVTGKSGSVRVTLIPAPQGTGLVAGGELKKILTFAGIKDIYSRTTGKKRTTFNLVKACMDALEKTNVGEEK